MVIHHGIANYVLSIKQSTLRDFIIVIFWIFTTAHIIIFRPHFIFGHSSLSHVDFDFDFVQR